MDGIALVIGLVFGGGVAGAAVWFAFRGLGPELEATKTELKSAGERLRNEEIARAKLEERCLLVDSLTAERDAVTAARDSLRDEVNEILMKMHALESSTAQEIALKEQEAESSRAHLMEREALLMKAIEEKTALLDKAEQELKQAFAALAADALSKNQRDFVQLAKEILKNQTDASKGDLEKRQLAIDNRLKPLEDTLKQYQEHIKQVELHQAENATKIEQQLKTLVDAQRQQQLTTSDLKGLLRGPTSRGRIGELFLKRMLDAAGLTEGVHYSLQISERTESGLSRPDCIVYLPSGKGLIIDCKTPLNAYYDSLETDDEAIRLAKIKEHSRNVRGEVDRLARRPYLNLNVDAELVVMYLPIEASLSAAFQFDPEIHTYGWNKKVVLSSPTLLYALLQMVLMDWRQQDVLQNAHEIEKVGKEMVDRIRIVADHFRTVGKSLDGATKAYNDAVSSMDRNLMATANRFQKLGAGTDAKINKLALVEKTTDSFKKPELLSALPLARIRELESAPTLDLDIFDESEPSEMAPG